MRFGATAAVTPQKMTCEHERKQPAERAVKAAAAPSRRGVVCYLGTSALLETTWKNQRQRQRTAWQDTREAVRAGNINE